MKRLLLRLLSLLSSRPCSVLYMGLGSASLNTWRCLFSPAVCAKQSRTVDCVHSRCALVFSAMYSCLSGLLGHTAPSLKLSEASPDPDGVGVCCFFLPFTMEILQAVGDITDVCMTLYNLPFSDFFLFIFYSSLRAMVGELTSFLVISQKSYPSLPVPNNLKMDTPSNLLCIFVVLGRRVNLTPVTSC